MSLWRKLSWLITARKSSGIIAEKPSEDLFTLDTKGSEPIQKSYNKHHKPLKTDQILAQRSAIPAIDSRKRSKVTDGVIEPSSKRRKSNGISHKEYQRLQNIAYGGESTSKDVTKEGNEPKYDPWTSPSEFDSPDPRIDFLVKPKPVKAPKTLKEAAISLVEGVSTLPAVPEPRAGASYNPVFEDYDKVLVEEGMKEIGAERKRLVEAELELERMSRIEEAQKEENDWQTEDESAWEGIESEFEGEEWLKKRRPERKTPAERNKIKRRKEAERQAKREAQVKRKAQQAQRVKEIAKEVSRKAADALISTKAEAPPFEHGGEMILRRRKLGKSG